MKLPRLSPGDAIEVIWIDANSPHINAWDTTDDFKASNPQMKIISLGFFIENRKDYLRMSGERSESKDYIEVANRVFNIPIGCIKKVRKMK